MHRQLTALFLATALAWNVAHAGDAFLLSDDLSTEALAAEIVRRLDRRESAADLIQPAADRGMALARVCAAALDSAQPQRSEALANLIAMSARCRQQHRELLRLYDPAAFENFYSANAEALQQPFAILLDLKPFPRQGAQALIHAAPRPLLKWLKGQAASTQPDLARLYGIWAQWGANIQFSKERQHLDDVRALAAAFLANAHIASEPRALAAALRFAGETVSTQSADALVTHLAHADPQVRLESVRALQRLGGAEPPAVLLSLSRHESDVRVLEALAEAFQEWPDSAATGAAALELFQRSTQVDVRRALVFSAARVGWPQRTDLLSAACDVGDGSILGAALQALGEKPAAELAAKTRALMAAYPEPPPPLVDALGALREPRAASYLIQALRSAENPALRLKIVLALERIGGDEAIAEMIEQFKSTANAAFAQQIVAALGRMKAAPADSAIAGMAEDVTAPLAVRMQCIWALATLPTPAALASIKKMDSEAQRYFGQTSSDTPSSQNEKTEQCRLLLKMALFQHGDAAAEQAAAELYSAGSPTTRVTMLMMLAQLKRDHPVIAEGLNSDEYAVILAAVNAAGASAPSRYRERLVALRDAEFIRAIVDANLNPGGLRESLRKALESVGVKP